MSAKYLFITLCLCALTLPLPCAPAFAWGSKGHRIIGALAEPRLSVAAAAAVAEILQGQDIAAATTWADEMRASSIKPRFWSQYAAHWHYVNVPLNMTYQNSAKNPQGDAYVALQTFSAILQNKPLAPGPVKAGLSTYFGNRAIADPNNYSKELKRFALRFMLHIIGDLQQPLHSGYASDRGGTAVALRWFGKPGNLHSVWDSQLLNTLDLSQREHTRRLETRITRLSTAQLQAFEVASPLVWISQAQALLPEIYAVHNADKNLGNNYIALFAPTLETGLIAGALRTAVYLNTLFTSQSTGAKP